MPIQFRLADLLKERGLTPRQFAKAHKLNYVTVLRVCRNETAGIRLRTIERLAAALDVSPFAIFLVTKE